MATGDRQIATREKNDNNLDSVWGTCNVCKKTCSNKCSRCCEFYCSVQCQRSDWKTHRYVCFKMPSLTFGTKHPNGPPNVGNASPNTKGVSGIQDGDSEYPKSNNNSRWSLDENSSAVNGKISLPSRSSSSASSTTEIQSSIKTLQFADQPKSNDDVVLTGVSTLNNQVNAYYIRTCQSNGECTQNTKDFHEHGKNGKQLSRVPVRNQIILVEHEGLFVRAIVINPSDRNNIKVGLVDIGCVALKKLDDTREISNDLLDRKRYNFKIVLNDIASVDEKKLLQLVDANIVFKLQFDGASFSSGKNFQLLKKNSGSTIDTLLKNYSTQPLNQTSTNKTISSVQEKLKSLPKMNSELTTPPTRVFVTDLVFQSFCNDYADLVVMDTSTISLGCVSAILFDNLKKVQILQSKIQEIAIGIHEEYEPELNEICLAKYVDDNDWYRAHYSAPDEFVFIDYGNASPVDKKDVRKLPNELREPCYTVVCFINGFPSNRRSFDTKEAIEKLSPDTVQKNCKITVLKSQIVGEEEEDVVFVTFPALSDLLIKSD